MNPNATNNNNWTTNRNEHFLINIFSNIFTDLPLPSNINYYWNFGSLLGLCMIIQLLTGILLAMHYCPSIFNAFSSVAHTTRNITTGFTLRNIHANSASFFFLCVYIHIARNLYHHTWTNNITWIAGLTIYLTMILTSFMGYVLPWGQMSFWAATVITNLLSAIPYIGTLLVQWLWGGFSVSNATLNRFFSLHYLFPFLLLILILIHLLALHTKPQSNPSGTQSNIDNIPFHQYYFLNDLLTAVLLSSLIFYFATSLPYLLSDSENFLNADPITTPPHIQPEWYFLFTYAILRSIPNKFGGVFALLMSIIILYLLVLLNHQNLITTNHRPNLNTTLWALSITFVLLTWLGSMPAESPFTNLSLIITSWYFIILLILLHTHTHNETNLINMPLSFNTKQSNVNNLILVF